jgi:hypothetical protein
VFVGDDLVHMLLVPVASVSGDCLRQLIDPCPLELAQGGGGHRVKLREVGREVGDLRGQDDVLLVDGGLSVVACTNRTRSGSALSQDR